MMSAAARDEAAKLPTTPTETEAEERGRIGIRIIIRIAGTLHLVACRERLEDTPDRVGFRGSTINLTQMLWMLREPVISK
jgi:hypothetical protein